jgi:hypothetical protein
MRNDLINTYRNTITNKNSILNEAIIEIIKEEEILCKLQGDCFGEWGLINDARRVSSAIAAEDTHLFILNKNDFKISLHKAITKTDNEKKNFILSRIKPYAELSKTKFQSEYVKIIPIFPKKGEIIFSELSPAKCFYLIYMGCCILVKNSIHQDKTNPSINYEKEKRNFCLLKIDKGDIIGLEALYDEKHSFTLKCDFEYTLIFSIEVSNIDEGLKAKIKENLFPIYNQFKQNINLIIEKHRFYNNKFKIRYRRNVLSQEIKRIENRNGDENEFTIKIEKTIENVLTNRKEFSENEIKSFKIEDKVNIGQGKNTLHFEGGLGSRSLSAIKLKKDEMNVNHLLTSTTEKIKLTENTNNLNNQNYETYLQSTHESSVNQHKFINITNAKNSHKIRAKSSLINSEITSHNNKSMNYLKNFSKFKPFILKTESNQRNEDNKKFKFIQNFQNFMTEPESPQLQHTKTSRPLNLKKTTNKLSGMISNNLSLKIDENMNTNKILNELSKNRIRLISKSNKTGANSLSNIKNTTINFVTDWKENMRYFRNSKIFPYNSGSFTIPLVTYTNKSNSNYNLP